MVVTKNTCLLRHIYVILFIIIKWTNNEELKFNKNLQEIPKEMRSQSMVTKLLFYPHDFDSFYAIT